MPEGTGRRLTVSAGGMDGWEEGGLQGAGLLGESPGGGSSKEKARREGPGKGPLCELD